MKHISVILISTVCLLTSLASAFAQEAVDSVVLSNNRLRYTVSGPSATAITLIEDAQCKECDCDCKIKVAVKTNLLYDALAVPNIGVEFPLPESFSIGADWMYAWWKTDRHHRYWRTYGGDIVVRKWFGSKLPLTGHHVGLYGNIVTYDFEWGGRGYLGDRWSYGGGVEYGYSLKVSQRLNFDFTIGVGYLGGKYKEYIPDQGCYVWQVTKQRHWFGPTKAEISLVWFIGKLSGKGGATEL